MDRIDRMPFSLRALSASPFVLALGGALAGCPAPGLTCPEGYVPAGDHCALGTDGGPGSDSGVAPDAGTMGDGSVTPDMGTDAFVPDMGTDACAWAAFYPDMDGDMHGAAMGTPMMACSAPTGYVSSHDDCNDMDMSVHPGATELCNAVDDDCDGMPDNGAGLQCVQGSAVMCMTACGSMGSMTGTGRCTASCQLPTGASCSAPAEMCNGIDDNCNGVADEGLFSLSTPSSIASGMSRTSPHLVALPSGFGVVYAGNDLHLYWQTFSSTGGSPSAVMTLGTDVLSSNSNFDVAFDGTNVVLAYPSANAGTATRLITFNPATASRVFPSGGALPYAFAGTPMMVGARVRIVDVSASHATVYVVQGNMTSGLRIHRYRINIPASGTAPTFAPEFDVATSVAYISLQAIAAWDVMVAEGYEYLAVRNSSNDIAFYRTPVGDTTRATDVTFLNVLSSASVGPNVARVAWGVRSATQPVSASNPLGLALSRTAPDGIYFVQFSQGMPLRVGTTVHLAGSGGYTGNLAAGQLQLLALPTSSTYMVAGHFLVAALDGAGSTTQTLRVWETTGEPPTTNAIALPDADWNTSRGDLSIATSGGVTRIAEEDNNGTIVTRTIGCM